MKRALELAETAKGRTSPNPMVGAVVVKNNRIVSSAYHRRIGTLHAEPLALEKAGKRARGATLYVNLEPCAHVGRTPPCTDVIIKSGIKKIYCAMVDPNPLNNGRGIKILRNNKIGVSVGLLKEDAQKLNEVFIKYIGRKVPFVTLKMAESLDGKIATKTKDSKWITSEASRRYVHKLRSEVDAILVGVNTVINDNPLLTSRRLRSPIKVVLDPYLKVPETSRIFTKDSPSLSVIAVLKESLKSKNAIQKIGRFNKKGILVIPCSGRGGRIDLKGLLKEMAELEIANLLIEGGGNTAAGFLEERLVDRILFFIAPKIIGGRDALTSIEGNGVKRVKDALRLKDVEVKRVGEDILVKGDL